MKTLFALLLLAAGSAIAADAQSAFESKDYAAAAKHLESELADSPPNAGGYYNLGLAYENAGEAVQAVLNYERALLLDPSLRPARDALTALAAKQNIPLPPHAWTADVNAVVHPDTLGLAGFALLWAGAFGLLFTTQAAARRRIWLNAASVLCLLAGLAALIAGWLSDARMTATLPAMVTASDGAEVLAAPANNSAPVVSLPAGTAVDVISPRGAWSYVDSPGGLRGWVQTPRLTPLIPGDTL